METVVVLVARDDTSSATDIEDVVAAETLDRTLVGTEMLVRAYLELGIAVQVHSHSFPDLVGSLQLQATVQTWGPVSSTSVVARTDPNRHPVSLLEHSVHLALWGLAHQN